MVIHGRALGCCSGVELREEIVVERPLGGVVDGSRMLKRVGRRRRTLAHAHREHQSWLVVLDEEDAAVHGTIIGDETDTSRWSSDLCDPVGDDTEARTTVINGS